MKITREELNSIYCRYYNKEENELLLVKGQTNISCKKSKTPVLFLDELNRANVDTLNASLQLVLERKLHAHHLPFTQGKPTMVIAAINPTDDDSNNYTVNELDPALLDRFLLIEVEADLQAWLKWARSEKINQIIIDFLIEYPDRLHWTPKDGGMGTTPRSWAKLAGFIDNINKIPEEVHFPIFKGKLGAAVAGQFLSFYNNYVDVVKMEDIEKLVNKHAKKESNIEKLGDKVQKLMEKAEAIQKTEMAHQLIEKYIEKDAKDTLPLMAYLYGLELELLAAFLKSYKETDSTNYMKLSKIDGALNNKGLFKKIVNKLKS